ncbi:helix-turn-helix transcriptional regulator [Pectobacteriaceae bacterium CE90]|nr:helix-turn-helix transcriptional regulator [Prodigiosinella sp. LS101]WJV52770.1 helix-turn-helix transcriptional regulator [Prodigiosinella sp. LS101]WJV57124.1 helix-turn-helix transcriptional regulator [Pectobacteriaceae bacterium C111]WJY16795.1 helix-turn-helix transcriptional regulator [Pectobacteriaceae bacterium CE90]
MSQGKRLKGERERLGFSQAEFAELAGASRKTQIRWEQDESSPGIDAMHRWSQKGLDVAYVITGQHQETKSAHGADIDTELLIKIVQKLDLIAKSAGRRWTSDELILQSSRIYNFLIKERSVDDVKIDSILKLVVNN